MNLIELLEATARRLPNHLALVEDFTVVSYSELVAKVNAWSAQLKPLGLSSGMRVGLCFANSIDYVALTYALWRIDAIVVPVPTECPSEELREIAVTMELAAILSQRALPESETLVPGIFYARLHLRKPADNHGINIAFIRFTSGTTNERKGVVLSHETIRNRVLTANKAFQITDADRVIWCLPMAHHFLITIVLYLNVGATIVLARHVTARPFLEAVNKWKGTILYAAPFHFALLARDNSGTQIDAVRLAISTTCALPQTVADDFHKRFGKSLSPALGIIELGLVALNDGGASDRWNSVGKVIEDFEIKILSPDENGVGEVAVRGPGMFDGYAAPWQPREKVLRDGWFVTGDLGRMSDDGFLYLISRKTAVINLAGRKVFPEEIEAVLNKHPAVQESRVFGRTHSHLGEVVEAEIVLKGATAKLDDMPAYCRQHLASYKIPTQFHVVPALPRTAATGKLLRMVAVR